MLSWPFVVLLAAALFGFLSRPLSIGRFWGPVLRAAGDGVVPAVLVSVAIQAVGLLVFILAWYAADQVGAVLLVPVGVLYAPVVGMAMPAHTGAYRNIRSLLVKAGASVRQARAAAWASGPPAILGFVLTCTAVSSVFGE